MLFNWGFSRKLHYLQEGYQNKDASPFFDTLVFSKTKARWVRAALAACRLLSPPLASGAGQRGPGSRQGNPPALSLHRFVARHPNPLTAAGWAAGSG